MNNRYTGDATLEELIGKLHKDIDRAAHMEACLECKKCNAILDVIKELSLHAREKLIDADPDNKVEIVTRQQTAKLFDAVILAIKRVIMDGDLAEKETLSMEEENG